jgi:hypothetical protein
MRQKFNIRAPAHRLFALLAASVGLAIPTIALGWPEVSLHLGNQTAVLVLVTDALPPRETYAPLRSVEQRADSILLLRSEVGCNRLSVASVPRDLTIDPGGEPITVLAETLGPIGLAQALNRVLHLGIAAVVSFDLADVAQLSNRLGPVALTLDSQSKDETTGFLGGPGPVTLIGDTTVRFLRSRSWQQRVGNEWVLVGTSDADRIEWLQRYIRAAFDRFEQLGRRDRVELEIAALSRGETKVLDPVAATRFLIAIRNLPTPSLATLAVHAEHSVEQRRSPFAPNDLGAANNFVLDAPDRWRPPCDGAGRVP